MNQSNHFCLLIAVIPLMIVQYASLLPAALPVHQTTTPATEKMQPTATNASLSVVPIEERGSQMRWEMEALVGMPFSKSIVFPFDTENPSD